MGQNDVKKISEEIEEILGECKYAKPVLELETSPGIVEEAAGDMTEETFPEGGIAPGQEEIPESELSKTESGNPGIGRAHV